MPQSSSLSRRAGLKSLNPLTPGRNEAQGINVAEVVGVHILGPNAGEIIQGRG